MDNASGVSLLLAAAEVFASNPPPLRSLIFQSLTGEEYGLLGASYWTQYPLIPNEAIILNINFDVVNIFGRTRDIVGLGLQYTDAKVKKDQFLC